MRNNASRITPAFKMPVAVFILMVMDALVMGWPVDPCLCMGYMAVAVKRTTALANQNQHTKQGNEAIHSIKWLTISVLKRAGT